MFKWLKQKLTKKEKIEEQQNSNEVKPVETTSLESLSDPDREKIKQAEIDRLTQRRKMTKREGINDPNEKDDVVHEVKKRWQTEKLTNRAIEVKKQQKDRKQKQKEEEQKRKELEREREAEAEAVRFAKEKEERRKRLRELDRLAKKEEELRKSIVTENLRKAIRDYRTLFHQEIDEFIEDFLIDPNNAPSFPKEAKNKIIQTMEKQVIINVVKRVSQIEKKIMDLETNQKR